MLTNIIMHIICVESKQNSALQKLRSSLLQPVVSNLLPQHTTTGRSLSLNQILTALTCQEL